MENAKSYSGLFIVVPEVEETIDEIKNDISTVISDNAGNVVSVNMMGKRRLAYPIKKKSAGVYMEILFNALPGSVEKMMKQFRINTDIMRTIISTQK